VTLAIARPANERTHSHNKTHQNQTDRQVEVAQRYYTHYTYTFE